MYFKVYFKGFEYIEADSKEEAQDMCFMGCDIYQEVKVTKAVEVDECIIDM